MIFLLVFPVTANAAGTTNTKEETALEGAEKHLKITISQDTTLENGISLREGEAFFVTQVDKESGKIQIGLEELPIPLSNGDVQPITEEDYTTFVEYSVNEEEPRFIELPAETLMYDTETESVLASNDTSIHYPIYKEENQRFVLVIGHKEVYINKEDLPLPATEENETPSSDGTSDSEVPVESDEAAVKDEVTDTDSLDEIKDSIDNEEPESKDAAPEEKSVSVEEDSMLQAASETTEDLKQDESFKKASAETSSLTFEETGYLKPTTNTLSIYDNSSGSLVKVGDLVENQSYKIISTSGNWHQVKFGKGHGFVWKPSTIPSTGEEIKNTNNTNASFLYEVHSEKTLSVYDNTSGSLVKMGNISPGVKYPVLSEAGNWLRIDFTGRIGYIYKPETKQVFTSNHKYFKVTSEFLSVYDNSTGALVKVGALEGEQQYPIVAISGSWIKIKFGSGFGFVWKDSTAPVSTPSIDNLNTSLKSSNRTIAADVYLAVYDNTSGSLVKFGAINPSVKYPIIDKMGNWYRVDLSGRVGFVYAPPTYINFLESDQYFDVRKPTAPVYASADNSSKVVGTLLEGETFKRIAEVGDWHKISFGDSYGFVLKTDTTLGYESNFTPKQNSPKDDQTFTSIQNVPVMDNSTGKLIQFAEIKKGVSYPFVSRSGNWVEINLGDRTGWVYKTGVQIGPLYTNSYSDYSFEQALNIQLSKAPQSDTTGYDAFVRWDAFDKFEGDYGFVNDVWNVRGGPGTSYWQLNSPTVVAANGPLIKGEKVQILGEQTVEVSPGHYEKWYKINFYRTYREDGNGGYKAHYRAFVNADPTETAYYMNPESFVTDDKARFQFLLLSESADADADKINAEMLTNRGNLSGKGAAFVEAGKLHRINEIYLVSHSILETGAGSSRESALLKGYKINSIKGQPVPEMTVYNVYGIAAYDSCPQSPAICAAEFAYEQQWFSVDAAIIGGAKFIGEKYIHRPSNNQNTLYKMRWNPDVPGTHQYATDIGWAYKQAVNYFSRYYSILGLKPKTFDIPVYQPSGSK
jgi:mannosyl-glycoprotein endo-beta-N-acetylglucosaminidase